MITKTEAQYTPNGTDAEHCGGCLHYRYPYGCVKVDGRVVFGGWCKLWERKTQRKEAA